MNRKEQRRLVVLNQVEVGKMIGREAAGLPILSFMALNLKRLVKLLTGVLALEAG